MVIKVNIKLLKSNVITYFDFFIEKNPFDGEILQL